MFEHFSCKKLNLGSITINYKIGGLGPPLLLLHGYPQTHVMWHKIAIDLSQKFTVIASDLRGYGDSSKPSTTKNHEAYSKRVMANDQLGLMESLGFTEFSVAGHDRGGRVAHRMALDYPERLKKMVVMDIAPTYTMYKSTDLDFATAYYHWFFLIQPYDLPERLIGADPIYYLHKKFGQWGKDSSAFTSEAMAEYQRCFTNETIHTSCEDYRASASIDLEHDEKNIQEKILIQCPLLCLWGRKGFVGNKYDLLSEWKKWTYTGDVKGFGLDCGHYLPEESPQETLKALLDFL